MKISWKVWRIFGPGGQSINGMLHIMGNSTYVELPALDMLAGVFTCDHNYEFGDLPPDHPFVQLRHDLLDVRFDLVIRRYKHCQAIFLDSANLSVVFSSNGRVEHTL